MMRIVRVMLWLRWKLLLNLLRPTKKRDTLERASQAFQVLGPVILTLVFLPAVVMAGFLGGLAGWYLPQPDSFHQPILLLLKVLLIFVTILALLAPLLRAAHGSTSHLGRLLLLPIPLRMLYASEVLGAFADPWMAVLASGSLMLPIGMALAGKWMGAMVALVSAAGLLAMLAGLGTLASSLAALIFRDRRRGEMATFILLILVVTIAFLPGILSTFQDSKQIPIGVRIGPDPVKKSASSLLRVEGPGWSESAAPSWTLVFPPALYARCIAKTADRGASAGLLSLVGLLLAAATVLWVGARIYRRLLETPEVASPRRRGAASKPQWLRLPGFSDSVSAVATTQVRLVYRSVQGKLQICILPVIILFMGVLWKGRPHELLPGGAPFPMGILLATFGLFLAMLTLEGTLLNQFAMDRAGLTLEFLSPLSDRDLILGKAAGGVILGASRAIPSVILAAAMAPGGSIFLWLSLPSAAVALFAIMAPVGAILSALFPKTVDLGRIGKQSKPHPAASLLGMLCSLAAMMPMAGLVMLCVFLLKSPALALAGVTAWAVTAVLVSVPLMRLAERILARRRENLALVAQGR
jgi:hypothetical protein